MAIGVFGLNKLSPAEKNAASAVTSSEPKMPAPVMVTTERVTTRPIQRRVSVVGSLWGEDEIGIMPKVDGRIVTIHKQVGQKVKPGDTLFEIEEKNYQLAVDEAKRSLELDLSKIGLRELPQENFEPVEPPRGCEGHVGRTVGPTEFSATDENRRLFGGGTRRRQIEMGRRQSQHPANALRRRDGPGPDPPQAGHAGEPLSSSPGRHQGNRPTEQRGGAVEEFRRRSSTSWPNATCRAAIRSVPGHCHQAGLSPW